jgi:hypothetical protein
MVSMALPLPVHDRVLDVRNGGNPGARATHGHRLPEQGYERQHDEGFAKHDGDGSTLRGLDFSRQLLRST